MDLYRTYRTIGKDPSDSATPAGLFVDAYLAAHLGRLHEDELLELGSGDGSTLAALKARGICRVKGTDISPAQVAAAHRNGVEVELCDGLVALKSRRPGSVGALIALDVLEHLQLDETLDWLTHGRMCLRDGGLLMVRVPNGEGLFCGAIRYGDITHRTAYTRNSIEQLFFAGGFELVEIRPCRPVVHDVFSLVRSLVWRLVEACLLVANAAESGQMRGACFTRNIFAVGRKQPESDPSRLHPASAP